MVVWLTRLLFPLHSVSSLRVEVVRGGSSQIPKRQQHAHSATPIITMKRPRPSAPLSTAKPPPSTPPTPQNLRHTRRSKTSPFSTSVPKPRKSILKTPPRPDSGTWVPLNMTQSELSLPLTLPTGQTFRWKQTGELQYTGTIGPHLISLKHLQDGNVSYFIHHTPCETSAKSALLDFLNAGISLGNIWKEFSASDSRFAELARYLGGARVLRQDPLECLIQFLCSSNNNIGRITKMVDYISSLGNFLGTVEGLEFHEFPSLEQLAKVSEEEFRKAGFGYRFF